MRSHLLPRTNSFQFIYRCILASQCGKESRDIISCNVDSTVSGQTIRKGFSAVDLRVDEEYICCSKNDVIPDEPLECYDIANHE